MSSLVGRTFKVYKVRTSREEMGLRFESQCLVIKKKHLFQKHSFLEVDKFKTGKVRC